MVMYNRYIPQPDGTYRRRAVSEPPMSKPPQAPPPHPQTSPPHPQTPPPRKPEPIRPEPGRAGFLRRILPAQFETEDLIVVLLILLIAGDCEDERNTALLTLALYFLL